MCVKNSIRILDRVHEYKINLQVTPSSCCDWGFVELSCLEIVIRAYCNFFSFFWIGKFLSLMGLELGTSHIPIKAYCKNFSTHKLSYTHQNSITQIIIISHTFRHQYLLLMCLVGKLMHCPSFDLIYWWTSERKSNVSQEWCKHYIKNKSSPSLYSGSNHVRCSSSRKKKLWTWFKWVFECPKISFKSLSIINDSKINNK